MCLASRPLVCMSDGAKRSSVVIQFRNGEEREILSSMFEGNMYLGCHMGNEVCIRVCSCALPAHMYVRVMACTLRQQYV